MIGSERRRSDERRVVEGDAWYGCDDDLVVIDLGSPESFGVCLGLAFGFVPPGVIFVIHGDRDGGGQASRVHFAVLP